MTAPNGKPPAAPAPAPGARPDSRWKRALTALDGDDEFSFYSSDNPKREDPVEIDPAREQPAAPGKPGFWAGAFRWIFR